MCFPSPNPFSQGADHKREVKEKWVSDSEAKTVVLGCPTIFGDLQHKQFFQNHTHTPHTHHTHRSFFLQGLSCSHLNSLLSPCTALLLPGKPVVSFSGCICIKFVYDAEPETATKSSNSAFLHSAPTSNLSVCQLFLGIRHLTEQGTHLTKK